MKNLKLILIGILGAMVAFAILLGATAFVGQLVGLSYREVFIDALFRISFSAPTLLVMAASVPLLLRRRKKRASKSKLALAGISLWFALIIADLITYLWLQSMWQREVPIESISNLSAVIVALESIGAALCWGLMIAAVILDRQEIDECHRSEAFDTCAT